MSVLKRFNGTTWETIGPSITSVRFDQINHMIAPQYDPNQTYTVGDYVVQSDNLYRCKTAITIPEDWTARHWGEVNLSDEVEDLKNTSFQFRGFLNALHITSLMECTETGWYSCGSPYIDNIVDLPADFPSTDSIVKLAVYNKVGPSLTPPYILQVLTSLSYKTWARIIRNNAVAFSWTRLPDSETIGNLSNQINAIQDDAFIFRGFLDALNITTLAECRTNGWYSCGGSYTYEITDLPSDFPVVGDSIVKLDVFTPVSANITKKFSLQVLTDYYRNVWIRLLRAGVVITDWTIVSGSTLFSGKKLSIIGDSFSAYGPDLPAGNRAYYTNTNNRGIKNAKEMWYRIVCAELGMTLLVNNSWSGSAVTDGIGSQPGDVPGSSPSRCEALDKDGVDPDVIIVAIGDNDYGFMTSMSQYGSWDGTTALGSAADLSDYDVSTFCTAYATMLARIRYKYPNAQVYCVTPWFAKRGTDNGVTYTNSIGKTYTEYGETIKKIAGLLGYHAIDGSNVGFNRYTYNPTYSDDSTGLHPNAAGHSVIAKSIIKQLKAQSQMV